MEAQNELRDVVGVGNGSTLLVCVCLCVEMVAMKTIKEVKLKADAELRRFFNVRDELWSAIYCGDLEVWSCPRDEESEMIKEWNRFGWKTIIDFRKEKKDEQM